jgi:small subunit ribosomal protein S21
VFSTLSRAAWQAQQACYSHYSCNNAREGTRLLVQVRDNNVDQALRALKRKMQREGVFREMKQRKYYEKPSEKRVREQAEAVRRARKLARKKAQREGLLPGKALVARSGRPGKPGGRPGGPGAPGGAGGPSRGGGFGGPR